ncbi:MAG: NusG domain II-containing protein [Oliverpabstia sp.]
MMKKRDWIAAAVILAAALIFALIGRLNADPAQALRITVNGETYGMYDITEDQEIRINDTNICQIEDGKVRMIWADCPDQICVHTAEISKDGGSIICLPNRIVLEIVSDIPEDLDEKVDVISS